MQVRQSFLTESAGGWLQNMPLLCNTFNLANTGSRSSENVAVCNGWGSQGWCPCPQPVLSLFLWLQEKTQPGAQGQHLQPWSVPGLQLKSQGGIFFYKQHLVQTRGTTQTSIHQQSLRKSRKEIKLRLSGNVCFTTACCVAIWTNPDHFNTAV